MNNRAPRGSDPDRWRRLSALLIVVVGVCISWALVAEFLLGIERRDWIWVPIYLLLVTLYWVPAWGAIASRSENVLDQGARWLKETGCLLIALLVFLLLCALLAILFT